MCNFAVTDRLIGLDYRDNPVNLVRSGYERSGCYVEYGKDDKNKYS